MKTKANKRRIHPIPLVICRTEADLESGEEMDRKKKKQNARKRGAAIEKNTLSLNRIYSNYLVRTGIRFNFSEQVVK